MEFHSINSLETEQVKAPATTVSRAIRRLASYKDRFPSSYWIAIEGTDGAGKSSLVEYLKSQLQLIGRPVEVTKWFSTQSVFDFAIHLDLQNVVDSKTASLIAAVELMARLDHEIYPLSNSVILADRYIHTAIAHDRVRGIEEDFCQIIYGLAPKPDITFLIDVPVELCLERIIQHRPVGFFEAGLDLHLGESLSESIRLFDTGQLEEKWIHQCFIEFKNQVRTMLLNMAHTQGFFILNGTLELEEQREAIESYLEARIDFSNPRSV